MRESTGRSAGGASNLPQTRFSVLLNLPSGNRHAWREFFSIYAPVIYRFARHARLTANDAEEVVAIVMRNMHTAFRNGLVIDPERGRFRSYLRTVANNEIRRLRFQRAAHAAQRLEGIREPEFRSETFALYEADEYLRNCMERLHQSQRVTPRNIEVFQMVALEGRSADEVALKYGISRSRVYVIKHEVTAELRAMHASLRQLFEED